MTSIKNSTTIENLNGNNYYNWRFKVAMLLIKDELTDVITGNGSDPRNHILDIKR